MLVTRPRDQSRELCTRLRALGARAIVIPTIEILPPAPGGPLDDALRTLHRYDWVIVTSVNGAKACLARARALRLNLRKVKGVRWAAVGPATAAALRGAGLRAAMVPSRYLTEAIARELPDVSSRRILLARTDAATAALADALRARGATVDTVEAYRTVLAPTQQGPRIRRLIASGAVDTVLFTSASTVRGFLQLLGRPNGALRTITIACIGPVTAGAAAEAGLRPDVVASEHTVDGLVEALRAVATARIQRARGR